MNEQEDPMIRAIKMLGFRRLFRMRDQDLRIACLLRTEDWRPLTAPWWRGKEVYIIGADLSGNFFLRHCDGSIRYWNHSSQKDDVIAPSVKAFVAGISEE